MGDRDGGTRLVGDSWYQACATTVSPLSPLSPAANCHHLDAKPRGLTSLTTICRDGVHE